jgi:hypothetical protein
MQLVILRHTHEGRLHRHAGGRTNHAVEFGDLGIGEFLRVLDAELDPLAGHLARRDDAGRDHRAEEVALAGLIEAGVFFEPLRIILSLVTQDRLAGDVGLEGELHELLGALAGDDALAGLIMDDVQVLALEGEGGVVDRERDPALGHQDSPQLGGLRRVELQRVHRHFLRLVVGVLLCLSCHESQGLPELVAESSPIHARRQIQLRRRHPRDASGAFDLVRPPSPPNALAGGSLGVSHRSFGADVPADPDCHRDPLF